jgi:UDPglucose--hexose-1-phosphate uridylyltransferase
MAKYVPDVKTQRWVVISPVRTKRPADAKALAGRPDFSGEKGAVHPEVPSESRGTKGCPFCSGNECLTPPEVYRIGEGEADKPGWQVRVVPNKFPITDIHEVFIHSANHIDNVDRLPSDQVARIFTAYRDRYRAHEKDGQVLIFCNHGYQAGASLAHPHSQLVVVPKQINLDSLSREPINNVVEDNTFFITYCPDFSQWPYETWIAPKAEGTMFGDTDDKMLGDLAYVIQRILKKISVVFMRSTIRPKDKADDPFVFNYYISHGQNWFLRIVPRLIHRAGFELGTGLNVNVIDPTEAAKELAKVTL